jgi:hypothetical protein
MQHHLFAARLLLSGGAREGMNNAAFRDSYRTYLSIREKADEDPLLPEIRQRLAGH